MRLPASMPNSLGYTVARASLMVLVADARVVVRGGLVRIRSCVTLPPTPISQSPTRDHRYPQHKQQDQFSCKERTLRALLEQSAQEVGEEGGALACGWGWGAGAVRGQKLQARAMHRACAQQDCALVIAGVGHAMDGIGEEMATRAEEGGRRGELGRAWGSAGAKSGHVHKAGRGVVQREAHRFTDSGQT